MFLDGLVRILCVQSSCKFQVISNNFTVFDNYFFFLCADNYKENCRFFFSNVHFSFDLKSSSHDHPMNTTHTHQYVNSVLASFVEKRLSFLLLIHRLFLFFFKRLPIVCTFIRLRCVFVKNRSVLETKVFDLHCTSFHCTLLFRRCVVVVVVVVVVAVCVFFFVFFSFIWNFTELIMIRKTVYDILFPSNTEKN